MKEGALSPQYCVIYLWMSPTMVHTYPPFGLASPSRPDRCKVALTHLHPDKIASPSFLARPLVSARRALLQLNPKVSFSPLPRSRYLGPWIRHRSVCRLLLSPMSPPGSTGISLPLDVMGGFGIILSLCRSHRSPSSSVGDDWIAIWRTTSSHPRASRTGYSYLACQPRLT